MPIARKDIIAKGEIAKYHCWNRCVRQAYLCGYDSHSGKNYDYRKGWVKERLQFLAAHFSIEVLADSVKRGAIPAHLAPVLQRFSMDVARWVETVEHYESLFWRVVGRAEAVIEAARRAGRRWFKGLRACERAFPAGTG